MNAKIMEIFPSIQGEGTYAGVRQVFLRFFECNMHCTWCDTPASIGDTTRNYKDMSYDEIMAVVRSMSEACHSVSLTGGEPLLQPEAVNALMPQIKAMGLKNYLETNGTLPNALADVIAGVDIIAMDIKLPSSTKERAFWLEHEDFLRVAQAKETFIKMVITNDTKDDEVKRAFDLVARVNPATIFILQPNYFEMKQGVVAKCEALAKGCAHVLKDVRIIPQMHKFMKVR